MVVGGSVGQEVKHVSLHGSLRLVLGSSRPSTPLTLQQSLVPSIVPSPHDALHCPKSPHGPHTFLGAVGNKPRKSSSPSRMENMIRT